MRPTLCPGQLVRDGDSESDSDVAVPTRLSSCEGAVPGVSSASGGLEVGLLSFLQENSRDVWPLLNGERERGGGSYRQGAASWISEKGVIGT